jgi:hypothetical protein
MFDALTPATLATPPRKGIGARIVHGLGRVGAALHGVVAGRLRRRPSGPDSPIAAEADGATAAMPARAPRQPRRRRIGVPERHRDLAFTAAAFPNLSPAARELFNTPLEDCDPAMVGIVLEALAEAIAGMMTPRDGMQDARDVYLALSSRLGALTGGTHGTLPETVPATPAEPADPVAPADPDATGAQAASPGLAGSTPGRFATGRFAAGRYAARRFAARRLVLARRTIPFHRQNILAWVKPPPRLLCYAACAGPPALAGAPNQARRVTRHARDHRMVVPPYLIPVA